MVWTPAHLVLAAMYVLGLLVAGVLAGRKTESSSQYLHAVGMLPMWVSTVACIAANCGSLDVIAMMGLGAQYGMVAAHFYWIGAIPALLVLAFWILPAYERGRHVSILDLILRYYGENTRTLVSLCVASMMLLISGACLCAVAQIFVVFFGWSFGQSAVLTSLIVLLYTWTGGIKATIYTELIHFAVVLAAIVPLFAMVVASFGGFGGLLKSIPADRLHSWQTLPNFAPGAPMDRLGLVVGLGIVLSFSYWSTDYVLMQRALAVRRGSEVRLVPLAIGAAKLVFAFLIVLPGVVAPIVLGAEPRGGWNTTLPAMILHYFRPSWVVIGIMGLMASLVATFANHVSGFSAAWMQGVYRPLLCVEAEDRHYLRIGRLTSGAAVVLSIGGAYIALEYQSMMEYMQMIFSTFNAPIFALVVVAALRRGRAVRGGVTGFLCGLGCAILHQVLAHADVLHYGSQMSANFYGATLSFACATAAILAFDGGQEAPQPVAPAARGTVRFEARYPWLLVFLAASLLGLCVAINVFFR